MKTGESGPKRTANFKMSRRWSVGILCSYWPGRRVLTHGATAPVLSRHVQMCYGSISSRDHTEHAERSGHVGWRLGVGKKRLQLVFQTFGFWQSPIKKIKLCSSLFLSPWVFQGKCNSHVRSIFILLDSKESGQVDSFGYQLEPATSIPLWEKSVVF